MLHVVHFDKEVYVIPIQYMKLLRHLLRMKYYVTTIRYMKDSSHILWHLTCIS